MTDRDPRKARRDDAREDDCDDAADTTRDGESADRAHGRRRVLAAAGASLSALAAAGCLSNPWGPERPGAGAATTGDANPATATTRDAGSTEDGDAATTSADTTRAEATTGDGEGTAAETTAPGESTTEATETATATATEVPPEEQEPDQVVEVAPDGFRFSPETFTIDAGDTVHWVWKDAGHNVRVREKPADSDWTGTPGGASDTYGEGYLHAHTFDASGEYECFCAPHQTLGLEGSFTVR
jgi:plastocyanin